MMMTNNNSNALEIKVLWINDTKEGENPIDLIDAAAEYSIDLVQHEYVESGISALKDASKTWHAVVLDANCKISSENEVPDTDALSFAKDELSKITDAPHWFVLSAGSGTDWEKDVNKIIGLPKSRPWDKYAQKLEEEKGRRFYSKLDEEDIENLWDAIEHDVQNREEYIIRRKYIEACTFYEGRDLIELLKKLESRQGFDRDAKCLQEVYAILGKVYTMCQQQGLPIEYDGTNYGACSKKIGDNNISYYIPKPIQRCFHLCTECVQEGHHEELTLPKSIVNGELPYLNRTVVYSLLNILSWCNKLPKEENEIEKLRAELSAKVKGSEFHYEGIVDRDDNGQYYCDEYKLKRTYDGIDVSKIIGKYIDITKYKDIQEPKYKRLAQAICIINNNTSGADNEKTTKSDYAESNGAVEVEQTVKEDESESVSVQVKIGENMDDKAVVPVDEAEVEPSVTEVEETMVDDTISAQDAVVEDAATSKKQSQKKLQKRHPKNIKLKGKKLKIK